MHEFKKTQTARHLGGLMCGIIALNGSSSLLHAYSGLQLLQHRGQDGFGIWAYGKSTLNIKQAGLVNRYDISREKSYHIALGHTRYSTIGRHSDQDLQPLVSEDLVIAHNGNVTNLTRIKKHYSTYNFISNNDAEVFLATLKGATIQNLKQKITNTLQEVEGAYSVCGVLEQKYLFAFKDPKGMKPLFMATKGKEIAFASEMQALYFLGYKEIQELEAGEVVIASDLGVLHREILCQKKKRPCMFEWVYFAGVEGSLNNLPVYQARLNLGKALASKIKNIESIDIVAPVPDTSRTSAIALSELINKPYREILIKNRYIQRSFILNNQEDRERAILWKLMPVLSEIKGKNILLVDDSIVRGTTSKRIIKVLKDCGAKTVQIASACPPLRHPCFYGIDFPNREDLVAHQKNEQEIAKTLGADAVYYLNEQDLKIALGQEDLCLACVNGDYPYSPNEENILKERVL